MIDSGRAKKRDVALDVVKARLVFSASQILSTLSAVLTESGKYPEGRNFIDTGNCFC